MRPARGESVLWAVVVVGVGVMQWTVRGEMLRPWRMEGKSGRVRNADAEWMVVQAAIESYYSKGIEKKSVGLFGAERQVGSAGLGVVVWFHTDEYVDLMRGVHIPTPERAHPSLLLLDRPHSSPPSSAVLRKPVFDGAVVEYSEGNHLQDLLLLLA